MNAYREVPRYATAPPFGFFTQRSAKDGDDTCHQVLIVDQGRRPFGELHRRFRGARAVRDPRGVLSEFGVTLGDDIAGDTTVPQRDP